MSKYRKFYVALAGFGAVLAQVVSDGSIDGAEAGLLVTAAITALGVFGLRNALSIPAGVQTVILDGEEYIKKADVFFPEDPEA